MELPIGAWRAWQVQAIPRVLVRVSPERDGRRGSVRAQNARCAPHAGVPHPLGRERQRAARRPGEGPPAVREESSAPHPAVGDHVRGRGAQRFFGLPF